MEVCAGFRKHYSWLTISSFLLFWLLCLGVKSAFAQLDLFFVFGDSYADTGNSPLGSTCWSPPYGMSWPGYPNGRFSDGLVKTDVLAMDAFTTHSPPPYNQLPASGGVNFAVAGSGVMTAFGAPPLDSQVQWFSGYVAAELLEPHKIKHAVAFVSVSGNDYAAYNGTALEGYFPLVFEVVRLIERNLRRLYELGIRNFMVSSVAPLGCLPARTAPTGYTACPLNSTVDQVIAAHNQRLGRTISSLLKTLNGSNFIYLQQTKALSYILKNPSAFGFREGLRPCCTGYCGIDNFEACDDPSKHVFWDYFHPTQAGWKAVVNLYYNHTGFTEFSPSLKAWANNLRF